VKTIILCGGKGRRLKPLTEDMPKTLVAINGKPCLQHILESNIRRGQSDFVLCIGYRGQRIVDFVEQHRFAARIEISDSGEDASMLARLCAARPLMGERAFVTYGDTLIEVDCASMAAAHVAGKAAVTLTTAEVRSPFGLVTMDADEWVVSYEEKPVHPFFVGHFLIESKVLDEASEDLIRMPDGDGLVQLFRDLVRQRRAKAYPYRGPQITFNTKQDLDQAELSFARFFTQDEGVPR
jgi:glucose-1-phosphate cytidylyltransferase